MMGLDSTGRLSAVELSTDRMKLTESLGDSLSSRASID